jgi:hypothetical protein
MAASLVSGEAQVMVMESFRLLAGSVLICARAKQCLGACVAMARLPIGSVSAGLDGREL